MIAALEDTRGLDPEPWEPIGRSRNGQGEFLGSEGARSVGDAGGRSGFGRRDPATRAVTRRGVVYEYVRGHPGSHVRGMARELGLATGDLQYHLSWLEKHGFVKTKKSGFYRFVFPTMVFGDEEEALLAILSQPTPREILLSLLCEASATQGELARRVGCSQPTLSWHMSRLIESGVVRGKRASRGISYEVASDPDTILNLVKAYHPEVWKRCAGRLGDRPVAHRATVAQNRWPFVGARLLLPAVVEVVEKR